MNLPSTSLSAQTNWSEQLTSAENLDFGPEFPAAVHAIEQAGRASTTVLQERLNVSYCRAARMIDAMERLGIIPPQLPSPARLRVAAPLSHAA